MTLTHRKQVKRTLRVFSYFIYSHIYFALLLLAVAVAVQRCFRKLSFWLKFFQRLCFVVFSLHSFIRSRHCYCYCFLNSFTFIGLYLAWMDYSTLMQKIETNANIYICSGLFHAKRLAALLYAKRKSSNGRAVLEVKEISITIQDRILNAFSLACLLPMISNDCIVLQTQITLYYSFYTCFQTLVKRIKNKQY